MKKNDLVTRVARQSNVGRTETARTLKALVGAIREALKNGDKVSLSGLGTFKIKARKARVGRNPQTGAVISIPAGRKISFKPSLSFKKLAKG
ncbi:MAG: HU family DNA-binding protein [Elusimicrobia bacterium]|nr:HU family DNA-binding protein [Elusimicrobiota bacterium]